MIVLKALAREYDIADLYRLRQYLRLRFGKRRRWRWDESTEQGDIRKVRAAIQDYLAAHKTT